MVISQVTGYKDYIVTCHTMITNEYVCRKTGHQGHNNDQKWKLLKERMRD